MKAVKTREYNLLGTMNTNPSNFYVPTHSSQNTTKKKHKLSPNDKFMKSFYSKQKSKAEYSPNGYRSISKEQIRNEIKKVVYGCRREDRYNIPLRGSEHADTQLQVIARESQNRQYPAMKEIPVQNIRTSLTPKSFSYPKKCSERQVQSTKATDGKNKDLFTSSGRYDLKQLFDRKRDKSEQDTSMHLPERDRPERQVPSSRAKRNNFVERNVDEDHTIKINEREEPYNVKAFLTADQYAKFGDRFPEKFKRIGLLGRGGFSVVWLGVHRSSKRKVAIKQILTKNPHETHLKEIWFGSYFFEKGGEPRQEFEGHMGINNICKLYSHEIKSIDSWLYYEVCDQSLGSSIFQLKGETISNERSYKIEYKELILRMREHPQELKILVVEVAKALMLINSHNIVHSDLKTENILLKTRKKEEVAQGSSYIKSIKLIDFGSSFLFTNLKQFSMATPQYMPPEILNYILFQNKLEYDQTMLLKMEKYKSPWVIDVWSLGCIVLEIISGVPLWMSIETRIEGTNERVTGLFAVKNRVFGKIIAKQIEVVSDLDYYLDNHNHSGVIILDDIRQVLKRMLSLNPDERISPFEILAECGVMCEPQRIPSY